MKMKPRLKAEITFLSRDAGGRKKMPDNDYVPHLVVQDPHLPTVSKQDKEFKEEQDLVVRLIRCPYDGEFNVPYIYELELCNYPHVDYHQLKPNVAFAVQEGSRTVGFGKIID